VAIGRSPFPGKEGRAVEDRVVGLRRLGPVVLVVTGLLAACADREPAEAPALAPQAVAAVVPVPVPVEPPPVYIARFECDGAILHQGLESRTESPIRFWFAVDTSMGVAGRLAAVGAPLALPGADLGGRISPDYDVDGNLFGGGLELDWPYARGRVTLSLMRETVRRAGQGVGRLVRATGEHTYLAGRLSLDPASHPRLAEVRATAFVTATCIAGPDLPLPR
jgi:hypothetical protein